jgi:N-acetylmuramoyl-L-alanine amidase
MKLSDIRTIMNIPAGEIGIPFVLIDEGTDTSQIPGSIAVNYKPAKQASFHGTCSAWIAYKASLAEIHCFRYGRKAALRYCAEHGIRLVSYSMRSTDFDVEEAEIIKKHGIIFVAAAGNSGSKGVEYPAKNDLTIAVAAYDPDGKYIEPYSSKGPEVDYTAYTDWLIDLPGGTRNFDGTSAAAPVIAGCLSIYLKYHPGATIEECRGFLRENSMDIDIAGWDTASGWGLFKFPKNDGWKEKEVIKTDKTARPLVLLDPGHSPKNDSGYDPGAVGNGIREADKTQEVCGLISTELKPYGIDALIIQPDEETLEKVVAEANKYKDAAFFLSIHINSAVSASATGFESFIYPNAVQSDTLRSLLHTDVSKFFADNGFRDRGKKYAAFQVLEGTIMPAMLFENLFINNPYDAAKLTSPAFLVSLAKAYAKGIARALGCALKPHPAPTVPTWAQEGITWGIANGLIDTQEGSDDWYRFMTVLKRYDKLRFG